jgi:hypothetical protein
MLRPQEDRPTVIAHPIEVPAIAESRTASLPLQEVLFDAGCTPIAYVEGYKVEADGE